MSQIPTVFVADEDASVREALRRLLESAGHTVELYSDAESLLDAVVPERPGCIVLDQWLPGLSAVELQRVLKMHGVKLPVIVVSSYGDASFAVEAMKVGAVDFIQKPFPQQRMLEAIRSALARDAHRRQLRAQENDVRERMSTLSKREREVMELVVSGVATRDIAEQLGIGVKTVTVHRSRINKKVAARNAADLVRLVNTARSVQADRDEEREQP